MRFNQFYYNYVKIYKFSASLKYWQYFYQLNDFKKSLKTKYDYQQEIPDFFISLYYVLKGKCTSHVD